MDIARCPWADPSNPLCLDYHDHEWGKPTHDDRELFELLILEGAQAGLSWRTILSKRENYKDVFENFDVTKVAAYGINKIESLLQNSGIVRNKLKVNSAIRNAKVFISIQKEYGSFDKYIWGFVEHKPIVNNFEKMEDVPASTELSEQISKDLKKRGMNFVGATIIYAYMQSTGMVNDHLVSCLARNTD